MPTTLAYERHHLRAAAPSIAMAWFTLQGHPPALPVEPQIYDLLVEMPEGIMRVQVKSTTCHTQDGHWVVKVSRGSSGKRSTEGRAPYAPGSIDYFFIVDGDLTLYLIPSQTLAGRVAVYVDTYHQHQVGTARNLLHPTSPRR